MPRPDRPTAEVLISFHDGASEEESTTTVHVRERLAPWRPLLELIEEVRQSPTFLPGPVAEAYRGTIEDASLLIFLLRAARGGSGGS
jgi:hypothetical protein